MQQYIFLDESGDLGFDTKKKNSLFFVITILFASDKKPLEKIVKNVHRTLRKKVKKLSGDILHCYKEKPITRKRLLKSLAEKDYTIMTIFLNKTKVYTHLQDEKHILYNYVVNILLDRIITRKLLDIRKPIILVVAKRETNKFVNANFKDYLQKQAKTNHKLRLEIEIKTPSEEKALQAVDFASWAIFRKYQHGDDSYYQVIKKIIVEERGLFS